MPTPPAPRARRLDAAGPLALLLLAFAVAVLWPTGAAAADGWHGVVLAPSASDRTASDRTASDRTASDRTPTRSLEPAGGAWAGRTAGTVGAADPAPDTVRTTGHRSGWVRSDRLEDPAGQPGSRQTREHRQLISAVLPAAAAVAVLAAYAVAARRRPGFKVSRSARPVCRAPPAAAA